MNSLSLMPNGVSAVYTVQSDFKTIQFIHKIYEYFYKYKKNLMLF